MVDLAIKLLIYNEALTDFLGERPLLSLSEARSPRRVLDSIWNAGAMDYCLEGANWNFAMRAVRGDYSPSITPAFGFTYAFNKPDDWLRTSAICSDDMFQNTLMKYSDEKGFWECDLQTIYVKYVSNDDAFGGDMTLWTQRFRKYVASYLAFKGAKRITGDRVEKDEVERDMKRALYAAKSHDAVGEAAVFPQTGSWVSSRMGRGNPSVIRTSGGWTGS